MAIWRLDKLYHDGLGGVINFDTSGNHFDLVSNNITTGEITIETNFSRELNEKGLVDSWSFIDDVNFDYSSAIDLMQLIPQKFHDSQLLQDYIHEVSMKVGSWLSKIKGLEELVDPHRVDEDYIRYLADLIGLNLYRTNSSTIEELRRQLLFAIPLYKMKGTYKVFQYLSYINNLTLSIYDMYCNSETNYNNGVFVRENWFSGKYRGENPSDLDSNYFKTPHLGLDFDLDKIYDSTLGIYSYLWKENLFTPFNWWSEKFRPANVVPHYSVVLKPVVLEIGTPYGTTNRIYSTITSNWTYTKGYFDGKSGVVDTQLYFDNGSFFDNSQTTFLNDIIYWKIGTGNKGVIPDKDTFTLSNVVLSGSITKYTTYSDRVEFEFCLPAGITQAGLSELGLFKSDNTTMVVASTFPNIDITEDVQLRVIVKVYNNTGLQYLLVYRDAANCGRIAECRFNEEMLQVWTNAYDKKYNRIALTGKTIHRWDTFEYGWDTAGSIERGYDLPASLITYDFYSTPVDFGLYYSAYVMVLTIHWKNIIGVDTLYTEVSTSADGINWSAWTVFSLGFVGNRFVKIRGKAIYTSSYNYIFGYDSTIFVAVPITS